MQLTRLQDLCDELNESNSTLDKKAVLKKFSDLRDDLSLIYDPFKMFGVTSDASKKNSKLTSNRVYKNLTELLNDLSDRVITGHEAIGSVNKFIEENSEYEELIYNIIDKDLKTRAGIKLINDVFPNCIPQFEVVLANGFKDYKKDIFKEDFYVSTKLDGCRLITIIDENGDTKFYSREGKEFLTLDVLKKEIESLKMKNMVLDGEVCIIDEDGNENFQSIVSLVKRKDYTIENPKYLLFDILKKEDFLAGSSDSIFEDRYEILNELLYSYKGNCLTVLQQTKVESQEQLDAFIAKAREDKREGLILRRNTFYKSGRSNDLLKIKDFSDAEYVVEDVEFGPFRMIKDGKEFTEETLCAVKIKHKGNVVSVGSGFSFEQRKAFYNDPSLIKGMTITVQYFSESTNKDGKMSLRFPIFKGIVGKGKRDI